VASLQRHEVLLRRFDFDPAFFGTFQFEFSKRHQRSRATWGGRERILTFEAAMVQSDSQRAIWQIIDESKREDGSSALAVLQDRIPCLLP
jgi:hypothetical protein